MTIHGFHNAGVSAAPVWVELEAVQHNTLTPGALSMADGASLAASLGGGNWNTHNKNTNGNAITALAITAAGIKATAGVGNTAPGIFGASAAGSFAIRRLFSDFHAELISKPRTRFRFAAAFTDLGDENTELVGIGWHSISNLSQTGHGGTLIYTGWSGGAAKVVGHHIVSTGSGTAFAIATGVYNALMFEYSAGLTLLYWGTADVNGMPPEITDVNPADAGWSTVDEPLALGSKDANAAGNVYGTGTTLKSVMMQAQCTQNTDGDLATTCTGRRAAIALIT
jgi:hypothetical protein